MARTRKRSWPRPLMVGTGLLSFVLVVAVFYFARAILIPIAVALFLTFVLTPVVTALQRFGLPRAPVVVLVVVVVMATLGAVGWVVTLQFKSLGDQLPAYQANINRKIADIRQMGRGGTLEKVSNAVEEVAAEIKREEQAAKPLPAERPLPVVIEEDRTTLFDGQLPGLLGPVLDQLANIALVFVLVLFMLIQREDLRNRLIRVIGVRDVSVTTRALNDLSARLGRYLFMQLVINGSFGIAVGVGLYFIGLPYPVLWGTLAAILRYIPYLGPWVAALLPIALSLVVTDGWVQPLLVTALFMTCELISNLVMEPMLYGSSVGISQSAILVAVAFWTWLWGPIGLVLATPLTVCLVILGKYIPHLRVFDLILGDEPALDYPSWFYQRLLAQDRQEAAAIMEAYRQRCGEAEFLRDFLVPVLRAIKRDRHRKRLTADEEQALLRHAGDLVDAFNNGQCEEDAATEPAPRRAVVIGCAAGDDVDELALRMFRHVLDHEALELVVASSQRSTADILSLIERRQPRALCVVSIPPGGLANACCLCERIRARFPGLPMIVGRWGHQRGTARAERLLLAAGADFYTDEPQATERQLLKSIQEPESAAPAQEPVAQRHDLPHPPAARRVDSRKLGLRDGNGRRTQ